MKKLKSFVNLSLAYDKQDANEEQINYYFNLFAYQFFFCHHTQSYSAYKTIEYTFL
jgi:hypothetical protein